MSLSSAFLPAQHPGAPVRQGAVAPELAIAGVWRASQIGRPMAAVVPTGWTQLDRELPGGGWPLQALTEVLTLQPAVLEWRLLCPALRQVAARGGQVVAVAPPRQPYLPGLLHQGLDERSFVWIQAGTPAQGLWATEQLLKANAGGAVVAWLPQARDDQIRRLQVCAQSSGGLVFLCRPDSARHQASAAPLRVQADCSPDWQLQLRILKRRGPVLDQPIALPSMPGGLASVITPRLLCPSRLFAPEVCANAVGGPDIALYARRNAAFQ